MTLAQLVEMFPDSDRLRESMEFRFDGQAHYLSGFVGALMWANIISCDDAQLLLSEIVEKQFGKDSL